MKEQDIPFVQPGMNVAVQIDALPGTAIKARVAQVVSAADRKTHSFVVKIDLPAMKGLITGMYGKALFITGKRQAVLVPKSAVVEMSGLSGVYVVSSEQNALFQMVQFGESHGELVEAITGLKAGDQVVIGNRKADIDGKKVVLAGE
jgi:multidrug efflux pump subunit AcrA (membrane-fusion protein)